MTDQLSTMQIAFVALLIVWALLGISIPLIMVRILLLPHPNDLIER